MKIEVKYWKEASDLMEILIENGYKVEIATKANYPFEDLYVVTIDNRIDEE